MYDLAMRNFFEYLQAKGKIPKNRFYLVPFLDTTLLALCVYTIYRFSVFYTGRNIFDIFISFVLTIASIIFSVVFLKQINQILKDLPYTRTSIYLFRKYIFLYEALILVFLTFFLGVNSSLLSLFKFENDLLNFCINTSLIVASCISTSTKATLEYTFTIWDFRHQANGDELFNDET